MPVLNPAEPWKRTGRYAIDELFKLQDRKGAEMVLAMTHEEVVTTHVAQVVRSYRDLPLILYHLQIEGARRAAPARRRAAHARVRHEGLLQLRPRRGGPERQLREARRRLRPHLRPLRAGVVPRRVRRRDDGRLRRARVHGAVRGGRGRRSRSRPAMRPTSRSRAPSRSRSRCRRRSSAPEEVHTPGLTTVEEVAGNLGVPAGALLKAYPVIVEGRGLVLVVVRGDHRVNEIKLRNALGADCRPAQPEEFAQKIGPAGFIGPVGADAPVLLDAAVARRRLRHRRQPRRLPPARRRAGPRLRLRARRRAHRRGRRHGRTASAIRIEAAIEVGEHLQARHALLRAARRDATSTSPAREQPIVMGSYGIGPARIAAAAVEQHGRRGGHRLAARARAVRRRAGRRSARAGSEEQAYADRLYDELRALGADVLYDDRDARARARSSPTPSCSAARCAITVGKRHAGGRRAGAAGAPRPRDARRAARGGRGGGARAVADAPVGGAHRASRRAGARPGRRTAAI